MERDTRKEKEAKVNFPMSSEDKGHVHGMASWSNSKYRNCDS